MGKPATRAARQLLGSLFASSLGLIAWATLRQQSTPTEPPPAAGTPPPAPDAPEPVPRAPSPVGAPRFGLPPGMRAFIVGAVSIGIAAAVALTPVLTRTGAWRLPVAIAGGVLLLAGCVYAFPPLLVAPRTPEDLADIHALPVKDRIQLADDHRKLQNDVRTSLLQAVAGGAVLVGVLFTWQQQQTTLRPAAGHQPPTCRSARSSSARPNRRAVQICGKPARRQQHRRPPRWAVRA